MNQSPSGILLVMEPDYLLIIEIFVGPWFSIHGFLPIVL